MKIMLRRNKLQKRHQTQPETFVYGSVLDALSTGLYPDKRHVLREFIQNSYDALRELRRTHRGANIRPIEIRVEKPSISIYDEGIGMSEKLMRQYRYIGFSEKDVSENVGFRGIGTISGIAVAKQIVVTSSRLGVPKRYQVVIDAASMFDKVQNERNPPLDGLLDQFTDVKEDREEKDAHYTLVELREIREDTEALYNVDDLHDYLQRNVPVPMDPAFQYASEIGEQLRLNVPDFFECELQLNRNKVYKPFQGNCLRPQYIPVFFSDKSDSGLLAYCWYVKNAEKGQFEERSRSGLVYRVKNFAVGDGDLSRKDLWERTPERAFYFFGEVHLLDGSLKPSSDRTNFEDNVARSRMYERCKRIAQQLSREAGQESAQRLFDQRLSLTEQIVQRRQEELQQGTLDVALKADVQFAVRKALEDVESRLKRTQGKRQKDAKDQQLIRKGKSVAKKAQVFLATLEREAGRLYDVTKAVPMSEEGKRLYNLVVEVLREELRTEQALLEKVLHRLRERVRDAFS